MTRVCWGAAAKYTADPVLEWCWASRRRQFVGIEPAMVCDTDPTLNRKWVGMLTSCVS